MSSWCWARTAARTPRGRFCEEYAARFPERVRLVCGVENIGWRANYLRTFEACRGRYVAYCDGDDWWCDPQKLQRQVAWLEAHPDCGMCYTRAESFYQATGRREADEEHHYTDFEHLLLRLTICNCTTVARRELIARYYREIRPAGIPKWLTDDAPMWLWFAACSRVAFLPEFTAVHRRLPQSVSHDTQYRRRIAFCDSLMEISLWFDARYGGGRQRFRLRRKQSSDALWVLSYNGPVREIPRAVAPRRAAHAAPGALPPKGAGAAREEDPLPPKPRKTATMTTQERYEGVIAWFSEHMPAAESELHYENPFQLLVAVVLSAQCTDKRVNMTTPALFAAFPTPQAMAQASAEEIFPSIRSISYPNNKARHLASMARMLCEEFGGEVPTDLEQLQRLPGVGRKTANVLGAVLWQRGDARRYARLPRGGAHRADNPLEDAAADRAAPRKRASRATCCPSRTTG